MELMVEPRRVPVAVPIPGGGEVLVDPRQHRAHVVRRLLCGGVSATTLRHLLPEWATLITQTEHELVAVGHRPPGAS